jgi:hypothetical protein
MGVDLDFGRFFAEPRKCFVVGATSSDALAFLAGEGALREQDRGGEGTGKDSSTPPCWGCAAHRGSAEFCLILRSFRCFRW